MRGPVTSPTFVIARVHPSTVGGPALVHVDAYRLGGALELDDLDLDASVDESVTVVEWGHGLAEDLSEDRLEVVLDVDTDHRGAHRDGHRRRRSLERRRPRMPGWSPWAVCRADPRASTPPPRRSASRCSRRGRPRASASTVDARAHTEKLAPLVARHPRGRRAHARPTSPTSPSAPAPGRSPGCGSGMVTAAHDGPRARHPGARRVQPRRARRAGAGRGDRRRRRGARRHRRPAQGGLLGALRPRRRRRGGASTEPAVDRPAELPMPCARCRPSGRGPLLFPDLFPHRPRQPLDVDPGVARAGGAAPARRPGEPMPVEPLYLRRPDALTTAERGAS